MSSFLLSSAATPTKIDGDRQPPIVVMNRHFERNGRLPARQTFFAVTLRNRSCRRLSKATLRQHMQKGFRQHQRLVHSPNFFGKQLLPLHHQLPEIWVRAMNDLSF